MLTHGRKDETNAMVLETATVLPFGECLLGGRPWPLGLPFGSLGKARGQTRQANAPGAFRT